MSRRDMVFIGLVLAFALAWTTAVAADPWEGFEGENTAWRAADRSWTDNNATGVALSTEYASEGRQSLKVGFSGPGQKACAYMDKDMDLSSAKAVTLDLYNATSGGQVAVAVCTGDSWKWQESPMVDVGPGWNKGLTFDLTSADWKSADTGWAYVAKPVDLEKVKRFVVIFWEGQEKSGAVYIDNILMVGLAGAGGPAGGEEGEGAEGVVKPAVRFSGRITPMVKYKTTDIAAEWVQIDPMEGTDGWAQAEACPVAIEASSDHVTAGSTSVKFTSTSATPADIKVKMDFNSPDNPMDWQVDWSSYVAFSFDVYNDTGQDINGCIALRNSSWSWDPYNCTFPAGQSTVVVPIIISAVETRQIDVQFWGMPAGTSIYFDNLKVQVRGVPDVITYRLDLTAKTSFGLQSNLVLDYIDDGSDAKFEVARGTLSLAGVRILYHDRFTNSDDYMKLYWEDPDNEDLDIERITWKGVEVNRNFGKLHLNALYLPGGPSIDGEKLDYNLFGLRMIYPVGKATLGLSGVRGAGEVVAIDATIPLGFANFGAEAGIAEGSTDNWGLFLVLKDGTSGPLGYYLEFMRTTPGFVTPDSEWSKENCQKFYGKVTYAPVDGLSLIGVYDCFHKLDGGWDKRAPSIEVDVDLFKPFSLKLYYETKDEGDTTPLPHTTKFEGTASYEGDALSASLLVRQETGKDTEHEFTLTWAFAETWQLAVEADLLTASDEYGLDLTKRFSETLDLTLSYDRKVEPTQTVTTYTLALGVNF
ncbi:MAG: hypothetical protein GX493_11015 [Firmicutes bacterium]|nr:hypothetical protein [Bacillota bacterium]